MIKTFKIGGIHLAENKIADRKIELLDLPRSVCTDQNLRDGTVHFDDHGSDIHLLRMFCPEK